jgi:hypothetical protein
MPPNHHRSRNSGQVARQKTLFFICCFRQRALALETKKNKKKKKKKKKPVKVEKLFFYYYWQSFSKRSRSLFFFFFQLFYFSPDSSLKRVGVVEFRDKAASYGEFNPRNRKRLVKQTPGPLGPTHTEGSATHTDAGQTLDLRPRVGAAVDIGVAVPSRAIAPLRPH